jgi:hypothetical protein
MITKVCEVAAVSELITDVGAVRALTDCGVQVTVVGDGQEGKQKPWPVRPALSDVRPTS